MKSLKIASAIVALGVIISPLSTNATDLLGSDQHPAPPEYAEAPNSDMSGIYIGIGAGYEHDDAWFENGDGKQISPDFAATGFIGTARLGYRPRLGRDWLADIFVEGNYHLKETAGSDIDDVDFEYCGGAGVGPEIGNAFLYINAGYCYMPIDIKELDDLNGAFAGLGANIDIGNGFNLGPEIRHTWRSGNINGTDIDIKDNAWSGRLMLNKKF